MMVSINRLLWWASKFADGMSYGSVADVSQVWCPGGFVHLWVDVPSYDSPRYYRSLERARSTLCGIFGSVGEREIDHGGALRETVFEPCLEFSVTVQMRSDLGEEFD